MSYHLTSIRMAVIKKSINNKFGKGAEKREASYTLGGIVNCPVFLFIQKSIHLSSIHLFLNLFMKEYPDR